MVCLHLYKTLQNASLSVGQKTQQWMFGDKGQWDGGITNGIGQPFGMLAMFVILTA